MGAKTLLLVDDDRDFRIMLANFIRKRLNIDVLETGDGQGALKIYQENKPTCVFLDVKMPNMDGFSVYEKIKEINPNAKIYFLTGLDDKEFKDKANQLGADGYITKPIVLDDVIRILEQL